MSTYRPPLTPTELRALIAYAASPPPAALHPLDAAELLRPALDPTHDAAIERILARVDPPSKLRPIQLSKEGLDRLLREGTFWSPPSRATPWRTWITDMHTRLKGLDAESNVPRGWWQGWWPPMYWMGQFVPHDRGVADGCRWTWRKVTPWPSNAGAPPATLDDLAVLVDAARARRFGLEPARRRSWRDFLPPWAQEREAAFDAAHATAATVGAT